eukprot:TRINITY_DN1510_c0_g1_i5.p1 TRINITY_DN1510_c0_g1~~TRINITY_DN1510_c0_g1_i5.p1  ORF type:complete len:342 (+),score=40.21 TRINITY_DN1510_c0_g1_i5:62-1087(+)
MERASGESHDSQSHSLSEPCCEDVHKCLQRRFIKMYPEKPDHIVTVVSDTPALRCLETLKVENVFCCPVVDRDHEERVIGLIDLVDICAFVVRLYDENPRATNPSKFDQLFAENLSFRIAAELMNYSKLNECHCLPIDTSFKGVLHTLSQPGIHRVPLLSRGTIISEILGQKKARPLARFITQSDVVHFIATHIDLFGPYVEESVDTIGIRQVLCVPTKISTIDAFREILKNKVTALGIVDESGVLVGNLSVRDIRQVLCAHPGMELNSSLADFITHIRAEYLTTPKKIITCSPKDTLRKTIITLDENHIHRLYIVDDQDKPVGVVSLTDICGYIYRVCGH